MTEDEREAAGIRSLPADLHEAIELANGSKILREALGDHVVEFLIRNKREEWDAYKSYVTPVRARALPADPVSRKRFRLGHPPDSRLTESAERPTFLGHRPDPGRLEHGSSVRFHRPRRGRRSRPLVAMALVAVVLIATPGSATFAKKYDLAMTTSTAPPIPVGTSSATIKATFTNKSLYSIGSVTLTVPTLRSRDAGEIHDHGLHAADFWCRHPRVGWAEPLDHRR